ncbi:MAG: hypothetical protein WC477_03935 [Patescibacteria group bacterium]
MKSTTLTELYGWIGVLCILGAYAAVNFHWLSPTSILYLSLNAFGSLGVVVDAFNQKNWQPVVLNAFWFLIALYGIATFGS